MTVAELMEKLKTLPPTTVVALPDITRVSSVWYCKEFCEVGGLVLIDNLPDPKQINPAWRKL